jgi:YVTN family beta-propeller protein
LRLVVRSLSFTEEADPPSGSEARRCGRRGIGPSQNKGGEMKLGSQGLRRQSHGSTAGTRALARLALLLAAIGSVLVAVPAAAVSGTITTIPVGAEPVGVAVNSLTDKTYVATRADNAVTVIQGLSVVATVPVGTFPRQVALNPVTNKVYVTNFLSDNVSVIDGSTDQVVATIPVGPQPFGVGVNPVTNKIYVSSLRTNSLSVIDGTTDKVVDRVPTHKSGAYSTAVNSVTNMIYVVNVGCCQNLGRSVTAINGETGKVVAIIDIGHKVNPQTLTVDEATNKIYVANACSGEARTVAECFNAALAGTNSTLSVIDGGTNTVTAQVTVGVLPFGPVADSERNTIYVPNLFSNTVSVIDGATDSVIDTEPVGACPAGSGVNTSTNRVYVSNLCDNTVTVLTRH